MRRDILLEELLERGRERLLLMRGGGETLVGGRRPVNFLVKKEILYSEHSLNKSLFFFLMVVFM